MKEKKKKWRSSESTFSLPIWTLGNFELLTQLMLWSFKERDSHSISLKVTGVARQVSKFSVLNEQFGVAE